MPISFDTDVFGASGGPETVEIKSSVSIMGGMRDQTGVDEWSASSRRNNGTACCRSAADKVLTSLMMLGLYLTNGKAKVTS